MKHILIVFVILFALGSNASAFVVKDLASREVNITHKAKRIVAIGPGALRLVCYMNLSKDVVGVENIEEKSTAPYIIANPHLKKLPIIGQGGPNSSVSPERILSVKPDVIFVSYLLDRQAADNLQSKTHIPVVVLSYGPIATFNNEDFKKSLFVIGEVCGNQKRAKEIIDFIDKTINNIKTLASKQQFKNTAYIGALGARGAHGIESTQGVFLPFELLGVKNAIPSNIRGSFMVDRELLLKSNPDYIFIDRGGLDLVRQDYKKSPMFYKKLKAFNDGNVYVEWPYNYYATNIDNALIDAFFIGKVLKPKAFSHIDIKQVSDEIYSFLLGKPIYSQMLNIYGPMGKFKP